ncbi:MAG TPA: HD domain-containing phosphohydrolase [Gemmatimonadaceae bacterium]
MRRRLTPAITAPANPRRVSMSEVLAALSYALDLTGGLPAGHTVRSCVIGMRIGSEIGLSAEESSALYDAMLLKDAGLSSSGAYVSALLGTRHLNRVTRVLGFGRDKHAGRDFVRVRSDRGAKVALRLGLPRATAHAIRSLDEHWNGGGLPDGKRGEEIPILSRIANLSQTVEAYRERHGYAAAMRVARERRGSWFDPRLVDIVLGWASERDWWSRLASAASAEVVAVEPSGHIRLVDERGIDDVARAFAEIIDAKSPFTYDHSTRVAQYATAIASELGIASLDVRRLNRAALLHDIGKLGVSGRVLDKAGPLTREEREAIQRHPAYTWQILSRVGAFADFAKMASLHHEKLDGSGYPWGVKGEDLDLPTRILCVADIFEALTAPRPYREAMAPSVALEIIRRDAGVKVCRVACEGLAVVTGRLSHRLAG